MQETAILKMEGAINREITWFSWFQITVHIMALKNKYRFSKDIDKKNNRLQERKTKQAH